MRPLSDVDNDVWRVSRGLHGTEVAKTRRQSRCGATSNAKSRDLWFPSSGNRHIIAKRYSLVQFQFVGKLLWTLSATCNHIEVMKGREGAGRMSKQRDVQESWYTGQRRNVYSVAGHPLELTS